MRLKGLKRGACALRISVTQQYGIGRETSDIDFLSVIAQSPDDLKQRYFEELRPYLLSKVTWHDKTLDLWLEMAWPTE